MRLHSQKILTQFRRCGRGILKGAAFRQRPLSRLLVKVLAETRTLPPEGPAPKASIRLGVKVQICSSRANVGIGPYKFYIMVLGN